MPIALRAVVCCVAVGCGGDGAFDSSAPTDGGGGATGGASPSGGAAGVTTTGGGAAGGGTSVGGAAAGQGGVSAGRGGDGPTGGVACPPCAAPPGPDCIGTGPCGCGPYVCSGGGAGGGGGVGPSSCEVVSGSYGDCEAEVGWGFDGARCRRYSGCDCGSDCGLLFSKATACAAACANAGECNASALHGGGIAFGFTEGSFCDEVYACTPSGAESDVGAFLPLPGGCETTASCGSLTCQTSLGGVVDSMEWSQVCAASLLGDVSVTCWVWGP